MSVLVPNIRRGQAKPYASVPRIDWTHPLAANLVSYNYDLGGQLIDLVNGGMGVETGGTATLASRAQSKLGYGYKYAGTASCDGAEAALPTVQAAKLMTAAPYAVAVGMLPTGSPTASTSIISIMDPANNFGFQLNVPSTATLFEVKYAGSAATPEDYITAANTNSVGVYHTVIGNAATSTTGSVYVDGKQDGTFSGNTTIFTSSTYQLLYNHIFVGGNSGSGGINGFIYYVAQWNRTLTAAEASLLHSEPYCFLIYPEEDMLAERVGVTASVALPFNTYEYPKVWDIRQAPYDVSVGLNPNLFKNPIPIFNGDGSSSKINPKWLPQPQIGINPNLFKNPIPFNQFDWSKPLRIPEAPFDLSVQTNPNLFKNPIPFLNIGGSSWGVTDLPVPQQPYNQNLYSVVVTTLPFNQTAWSKSTTVRRAPSFDAPYNQNLYQVTYTLMGQVWC